MELLKKIKGAKYQNKFCRVVKVSPFWLAAILSLIFFIWGGIIFHQYFLAAPSIVQNEEIKVDVELFNKIKNRVQSRTQNIAEALARTYPDIFR